MKYLQTYLPTLHETPNVTLHATGPWRLDWGDGAGPILNGTEHTFALAGEFLVTASLTCVLSSPVSLPSSASLTCVSSSKASLTFVSSLPSAFLDKLPHIMDGIPVRVLEPPNATLVCPPVVAVGLEEDCEFVTSSIGQNFTLTTEFTHPGFPLALYFFLNVFAFSNIFPPRYSLSFVTSDVKSPVTQWLFLRESNFSPHLFSLISPSSSLLLTPYLSINLFFPSSPCPSPADIQSIYGAVLGLESLGATYAVAASYGVVIEDGRASAGEVARVYVTASAVGWIGIYAVSPACDVGEYCWESNTCSPSCVLDSSVHTCADYMCVNGPRCEASPCSTNSTAPTANTYKWRPLLAFYVDTVDTPFTYLVDRDAPAVYEGEQLAFGCLDPADCSPGGAVVKSRVEQTPEKHNRGIFDGSLSYVASVVSNSTIKQLVAVVVRQHPHINANFTVSCTSASSIPTADVGPTFTAESEAYALMGAFNLTFSLSATLGEWTNTSEVICQQEILTPTLLPELWVALWEPRVLPITFTQGAPMFSSLILGPKHYLCLHGE
ncbi:hypothetical protein C7M84_021398 [Penaeus vannamei]|uniref:Uncharacterized protein n=1 Tax=Penaeus vannamei TaxID=6689 RepID=A0A3R7NKR8_PENVA|nr:hypothetical protein C7M84_021398 [Penaeus vannamei]